MDVEILLLPSSYLSVVHGIKDILDYAGELVPGCFRVRVTPAEDFLKSRKVPGLCIIPAIALDGRGRGVPLLEPVAARLAGIAAKGGVPASVCAGAFYLAASGLADGRGLTTHWKLAARLRAAFPAVRVREERVLIDEGLYLSAAGLTSYQDLCLYLIKKRAGRAAALEAAGQFLIDPADRSQLAYASLKLDLPAGGGLAAEALARIGAGAEGGAAGLARDLGVSPRTLERRFRAEGLGSPAGALRAARIAKACRLLDSTGASIKAIAAECGYADVAAFSRAFKRAKGLGPGEYRRRRATLR